MPAPEAYVGMVAGKYDGDRLVDDSSRAFFQTFIDTFAAWVERHAK
jgi:chromate reductase